jgi:phospholipase/lecithinase/hemolysin
MAITLSSLIDGFKAATGTAPIPTAALGTDASPTFLGADEAITVPAGGFSAVYSFGDSLSDAGNVAFATHGAVPVSPYSNGVFSNGPVWAQDLSVDLGLPAEKPSLLGGTDYAYGGATTGATSAHALNPTDLPSQLGQFVMNVPSPSPNALYTVWAGSNDILDILGNNESPAQQQLDVQQAVKNETAMLDGLIAHGATNLLVLGVPDLGKTPYETARPTTDAAASSLAQTYNTDLGAALQQIIASGVAHVGYVDTYAFMDDAVANPAKYGFTNVTQPLWNGSLTDSNSGTLAATGAAQSGYLFFDSLHPSASAHAALASGIASALTTA